MSQIIRRALGAVEYTLPTEILAKDNISADPVQISLGNDRMPGSWSAPDVDEPQQNPNLRVVQKLIDSSVPPGTYYVWVKITDSPEIVPRRAGRLTVI